MCYPAAPPSSSPEVTVSKKRWGSGLFFPKQMVKALSQLKLKSNGKELQQHIRSITGKATQKVRRVRRWVFNFNFSKLCVPIVLLGFIMLLHPHREIQLGVIVGILIFFFVFFITTREDQHEEESVLDKSSLNTNQKLNSESTLYKSSLNTKQEINSEDFLPPSLSIPLLLYSILPLQFISQLWGMLADKELPQPLNYFSVWLFMKATGCKRDEAEFDDLSCYKTVSQFFTRKLKPGLRPISTSSSLVSPCDGTMTYSGLVEGHYLEQVKGVHYSLNVFLGRLDNINQHSTNIPLRNLSLLEDGKQDKFIAQQKQVSSISPHSHLLLSHSRTPTCLYQTVIYLSPSDYHRFHSPASWTVIKRRHFPGKLYSVAPSIVRRIPGLFHTNERVAFIGRWNYGFFAMVAVGATNVGSIKVCFDDELATNTNTSCSSISEKIYEAPIEFEKGDEFGHFNFGSTIVLIYEASSEITIGSEQVKRVQMGESMWMWDVGF